MLKVLLIVVQGKPEGKTIPITGPVFRIGRGDDCHLKPNSEEVSRKHVEIQIGESSVIVRDLGSRNGTRVNGKLLTAPHTLKSGELLQIGPLTFAVAIQGVPSGKAEATSGTPATAAATASLDDVPPNQIDAWLVSDYAHPTPDRPSGVYDGETLTIDAYKENVQSKPEAASPAKAAPPAKEVARAKPETPAPAPAPKPAPAQTEDRVPDSASLFERHLEGIEPLAEGAGDAPPVVQAEDADETDEDRAAEEEMAEELIDENNPFYAAKKAASSEAESTSKATVYKDTSDAATDILRKMLDRRRASR